MHREFHPSDEAFRPQSRLGLYALTILVGGLVIADIGPAVARWLESLGVAVPTWETRDLFRFRFALIAAVLGGARALYSALERLTEGQLGADLAIAIACIAAILIGEPLVAAEVVFIGLVGECLEAITFARTQHALGSLAELFPRRCWVLRDGREERIFSHEVVVGDHAVIKPGGKVPADGVILSGQASVNVAAITGESLPAPMQPGMPILAGSIVLDGTLTIDVRKVQNETVAGQIQTLTLKALQQKGNQERFADRFARYFLPVVLFLAALTFLGHVAWQMGLRSGGASLPFAIAARLAVYPTLAVLVVACPCPLVLATPASVMAALARLSGTGVFFKGGAVLERLAGITAIAFDKTGTLTEGRLELAEIVPLTDISETELLTLAASAEQPSEHLLARLVVDEAARRELPLKPSLGFQAYPGAGIAATVDDQLIRIGTRPYLETSGIPISSAVDETLIRLDAAGTSSLLIARGDVVIGAIAARDRLRPEAAGVLADLRDLGLAPILLLTGDRPAAVTAIAGQLPLTATHASLLPAQKAEYLTPTMAFVGDGINDAPALAKASVGLAIGSGSDLAAETGDVILLGDPLKHLPFLVRLSRQTTTIIRQNIIWFGFGVNLLGIVLTGWLWPFLSSSAAWFESSPLAAAIFHQIGSLAVLLNAMRLLAFERSSPALDTWSDRLRTLEQRAARFHLDDWLHELTHHARPILMGLAGIVAVIWSLSGLTAIEPNEVGIVRRWGALGETLNPGLHLRWPWPIETVDRVRPEEVRLVEVGFRTLSAERAAELQRGEEQQRRLRRPGGGDATSLTWSAAHASDVTRLPDEALLITGDGNLVELLATVRYSISDPKQYLLAAQNLDGLLRSAAESVFRELASSGSFLEMMTAGRGRIESTARARLERRLTELAPGGLGIRIEAVTLHDLHPPQQVVASYHAVAEAIQRRDKTVNEAEAEAQRMRRRAEELALEQVRRGEAEATRKVADSRATMDVFRAWVAARSTLSPMEEQTLAQERDRRLKQGEAAATVDAQLAERRRQMLSERRALTDLRLYLQAIVSVLRGRDKIVIDTDTLPGKRHLWLVDPDGPRMPMIPARPESKDP